MQIMQLIMRSVIAAFSNAPLMNEALNFKWLCAKSLGKERLMAVRRFICYCRRCFDWHKNRFGGRNA